MEGDGEHMDPWVHLYPSINRGSHPLSIHGFKLQVKSSVAPFYLSSIGYYSVGVRLESSLLRVPELSSRI